MNAGYALGRGRAQGTAWCRRWPHGGNFGALRGVNITIIDGAAQYTAAWARTFPRLQPSRAGTADVAGPSATESGSRSRPTGKLDDELGELVRFVLRNEATRGLDAHEPAVPDSRRE